MPGSGGMPYWDGGSEEGRGGGSEVGSGGGMLGIAG